MTTTKKTQARKKPDWEAVERDYRTGRFTLRELEKKHGPAFATIGQRAKREGWTQDLQEAVRRTTSAKLIESLVTHEAHKAAQGATQAVQAAAEVNKQVILAHRSRVREAASVAMDMLNELRLTTTQADEIRALFEKLTEDIGGPELAAAQKQFDDFMKLHTRVASVQKLMDALGKAQTLERQAFSLDDNDKPIDTHAPADWSSMSPAERQSAYMRMIGA